MRFRCNNEECQHEFILNITEEELDILPKCPICKDEYTRSYRIEDE